MLIPDRLRHIRAQLAEQGSVRIDDLVDALGVSAWTVRRDLAELEQHGELRRTHGGAYLERAGRPSGPARPGAAASGADGPKQRIATEAARRIRDDSTVMLVGGSTTAALVPLLVRRRLTIVTNGLEIAYGLMNAPDVSLVLLGGYLHREQMTLIGPLSEATMSDLHVDVIVAGAYGVHPQVGVTGSKIIQAGYQRGMLSHADGLMILADASKLGRRGSTVLAATSDVTTLITDDTAPADIVTDLREAGVEIEVV